MQSRITDASHGRLFAVVHIAGKQFRVTDGDLIAVQGRTPTRIGDALRLEKVAPLRSKRNTCVLLAIDLHCFVGKDVFFFLKETPCRGTCKGCSTLHQDYGIIPNQNNDSLSTLLSNL